MTEPIVRPEPGSPESLAKHNDWLYGDQPETCRCDHAWKPLGRLHGVNMGHGWVRMNTHPDCLYHSKCHGFTDTIRAKGPAWWGRHLYCPIHKTKNCPKRTTYRVRIPGDNGSHQDHLLAAYNHVRGRGIGRGSDDA